MIRTQIQKVTDTSCLKTLIHDWRGLAESCTGMTFNQTPAYGLLAMTKALEYGDDVYLVCLREDDHLVGVWPLHIRREGLFRVMRPAGCGSFEEYSSPLLNPRIEAVGASLMLAASLSIPCDIQWVIAVPPETVFGNALFSGPLFGLAKRLGQIRGYEVALRGFGSWGEYADQASTSHMAGLRRKMRRLQEQGDVEIGWCRSIDDVEAVLIWAFQNKASWARARGYRSGRIFNGHIQEFFKHLVRRI